MGCAGAVHERYRHLVADGAVRTDLVVVSTPMLRLPPGVVKRQEPTGVQTLRPELAVERLDERVVGRFAQPREVEHDIPLVGPQIEVARDELRALIDPDRLRIAMLAADPFERGDDILAAIAEAGDRPPARSATRCRRWSERAASCPSPADRARSPSPRSGCISSPRFDRP